MDQGNDGDPALETGSLSNRANPDDEGVMV
jgi:hypothetical protein